MAKLFGTDGPRGIAVTDLTCELAMQTGRAAALVLAKKDGGRTKILIGKDTRVSSDALEAAVCAGICSVGADAELLGIVPAPAVTYLIGEREADGGIMISGSHNSAEYNGLKLFSAKGCKLMEDAEEEIERLVLTAPEEIKLRSHDQVGRILHGESAAEEYTEHIRALTGANLSGLKVALDCANGCTSYTAEKLFTALGAEPLVIADKPDGNNINRECCSTNVHRLMEFVVENGCDCGLAFDGDADRCIAVDEKGCIVDGDRQLAIFACCMKEKGLLRKDTVVVTAGSTLGFRRYAAEHGINEHDGRADVQAHMRSYPQVKLYVKIHPHYKELWKNEKNITELIEKYSKELGDEGRIVVRESGKEPIVRLIIEGGDFGRINDMAVDIAQNIKDTCTFRG